MQTSRSCIGLFACAILPGVSLAQTPSFTPLGDLPGGTFNSSAAAISADGQVVVGTSLSSNGQEAFRWTRSGGLEGLGDFGTPDASSGVGVSGDGLVVVGRGRQSSSQQPAFMWTAGAGLQALQSLVPGASTARSASADGSVIVGITNDPDGGQEGFRWTSAAGMQGLGRFQGPFPHSEAYAVTPDGSVIVGRSDGTDGAEAVRWTTQGGIEGLGDLPGGGFWSEAHAISANGSVIVGFADNSATRLVPASWTAATGWTDLGLLQEPFINSGMATAVSADGSVIAGRCGSDINVPLSAFIWDQSHGMRDLHDVLVGLGINLTGWQLTSVTGISADGTTLCGTGVNPSGQPEGWVAVVPAPGASLAPMVATFWTARRRRRGQRRTQHV